MPYLGGGIREIEKVFSKVTETLFNYKLKFGKALKKIKQDKWINDYGAQPLHPLYAESCAINGEISEVIKCIESPKNFVIFNECYRINIANNVSKLTGKETKAFFDIKYAGRILTKESPFAAYDTILIIDKSINPKDLWKMLKIIDHENTDNIILVILGVKTDLRFSQRTDSKYFTQISSILTKSELKYLTYIYITGQGVFEFFPEVFYKFNLVRIVAMLISSVVTKIKNYISRKDSFNVSKSGDDGKWSCAVCCLRKDKIGAAIRDIQNLNINKV